MESETQNIDLPIFDSEIYSTKKINPKEILLADMTVEEIGKRMMEYLPPLDRPFVHVDGPVFKKAAAFLRSCFDKFRECFKKGVFMLRCCNVYWFGQKPDPCIHIIDDEFRKFTDKRNRKEFGVDDLISSDEEEIVEKEPEFLDTNDTSNQIEEKISLRPNIIYDCVDEALSFQMLKLYAKYTGCFDEESGIIGLPSIVVSHHGRPNNQAHLNCFYAGYTQEELKQAQLRTSILNVVDQYSFLIQTISSKICDCRRGSSFGQRNKENLQTHVGSNS